eukprot:1394841-Amorphochlora_amoeboformis.AAC.1
MRVRISLEEARLGCVEPVVDRNRRNRYPESPRLRFAIVRRININFLKYRPELTESFVTSVLATSGATPWGDESDDRRTRESSGIFFPRSEGIIVFILGKYTAQVQWTVGFAFIYGVIWKVAPKLSKIEERYRATFADNLFNIPFLPVLCYTAIVGSASLGASVESRWAETTPESTAFLVSHI